MSTVLTSRSVDTRFQTIMRQQAMLNTSHTRTKGFVRACVRACTRSFAAKIGACISEHEFHGAGAYRSAGSGSNPKRITRQLLYEPEECLNCRLSYCGGSETGKYSLLVTVAMIYGISGRGPIFHP